MNPSPAPAKPNPHPCSQCGKPKTGSNPFLCEACMLANYGPRKPWRRNYGQAPSK